MNTSGSAFNLSSGQGGCGYSNSGHNTAPSPQKVQVIAVGSVPDHIMRTVIKPITLSAS